MEGADGVLESDEVVEELEAVLADVSEPLVVDAPAEPDELDEPDEPRASFL